ncbi:MAG TPA: hypothetical protein VNJ47_04490 [Nevskiales bacterium]|nr:hypothetical protein [Nevskiales bacterium]
MHSVRLWLAAVGAAGILAAGGAHAADSKTPEQAELEALRAEVQRLRAEKTAAPCLNTASTQPPPAGGSPGGTPKYLLKARWDRLESGMEKDEVRALLGRPSTITRSAAGQVEIWGYGEPQGNRYGVGTVYFDDDEELTTWISPTFKVD